MGKTDTPVKQAAPAFQFYARDEYLAGADLTSAEFGAHMRGLCWSWDNGPLPLDEQRRRRALQFDESEWAAAWAALAGRLWTQTPAGCVNQRLERQRAQHAEYRALQSRKGQRSGEVRRGRNANTANTGSPAVSTESEPATNPGSTGVSTESEPEAQPETNSPISDQNDYLPTPKVVDRHVSFDSSVQGLQPTPHNHHFFRRVARFV
jgi:uncharacterized protein YdaU (DUF1376 family)